MISNLDVLKIEKQINYDSIKAIRESDNRKYHILFVNNCTGLLFDNNLHIIDTLENVSSFTQFYWTEHYVTYTTSTPTNIYLNYLCRINLINGEITKFTNMHSIYYMGRTDDTLFFEYLSHRIIRNRHKSKIIICTDSRARYENYVKSKFYADSLNLCYFNSKGIALYTKEFNFVLYNYKKSNDRNISSKGLIQYSDINSLTVRNAGLICLLSNTKTAIVIDSSGMKYIFFDKPIKGSIIDFTQYQDNIFIAVKALTENGDQLQILTYSLNGNFVNMCQVIY